MQTELVLLGLMIIVASVSALIMRRLGQPLLLGYVIAGVLLGPAVFGMITDPAELLNFIIELGLIFLMFIIGLELDLSKIKDVGKTSALIGIIEVIVVTLICALCSLVLGFTFIQGAYIGLVVSLSSTIVVVKILTEIKEIDSLHGELVLGILVIQDILAVVGLTVLGTLRGDAGSHSLLEQGAEILHLAIPHNGIVVTIILILNLLLFALFAYLFYKYIMPAIFRQALKSTELLFVVSLAVMLVLSAMAGLFSFSLAMGAFLAGIALSTAPYSHEIMGRIKPLKDFFLLLFFVSLGMQIGFENPVPHLPLIIIIVAGTLILKPCVIFIICKLFRYNSRTSFLVGLHLAQTSEFSLVLVASGMAAGVLGASFLTVVVILTILTMVLTAYIIKYDENLYQVFKHFLGPLDKLFSSRAEQTRNIPESYKPQIIILGVNSTTAETIEVLHTTKRILVIDYNPTKIISYRERGIPTICNDATDPDLFEAIDFSSVESVVSVVHQHTSNLVIIKKIQQISMEQKRKIQIIMSATTEEWGKKLYRSGATLVLMPDVISRKLLTEVLAAEDKGATIRAIGKLYFDELHKNFVYIREI